MAGGVALPEREVEALLEGLAPRDKDAVGEELTVLLALRVVEGVAPGVSEPLGVGLPVGLPEPVWVADSEVD